MNDRDIKRLERCSQWHSQRAKFERILRVLFEHDPVAICTEENPKRESEYALETNCILLRIPAASSQQDTEQIVREVFAECFYDRYGRCECLSAVSTAIWQIACEPG